MVGIIKIKKLDDGYIVYSSLYTYFYETLDEVFKFLAHYFEGK